MHRRDLFPASEACRLLAVLFYDPEEIFASDGEAFFTEHLDVIEAYDADLHHQLVLLRDAYREEDISRLRVDFSALFVGPFELLAAPFGSVHLEKNHRLYGQTTALLEDLYRQAGLRVEEGSGMIPDHIAVELEFAHYLLNRLATGKHDDCTAYLEVFIGRFLGPFAEQLAKDIQTHAQTEFYRIVGAMLALLVGRLRQDLPLETGRMKTTEATVDISFPPMPTTTDR